MRYRLFQVISWALYGALLFPTVGPLVDHHFAERHPHHTHIVTNSQHSHYHNSPHSHLPKEIPPTNDSIYTYDGLMAGSLLITVDEDDLRNLVHFEPSAWFIMPSPIHSGIYKIFHPPPKQPPKDTA